MSVRLDRPRLLLNADLLPALQARAVGTNDRWTGFIDMVNTHMTAGWDVGVANYALAYLMTGRGDYAAAAAGLLDLWSQDPVGAISGDSGYQCRVVLPGMAIGFDWCYPALTAAQKARYGGAMEQMGNWVWPETNPARSTGWAIDAPGNNYYYGFLQTWMVGLALMGESPLAQGWIDLARAKFEMRVLPYLATWGQGGCFLEGSSYGGESARLLFMLLEGHRTATGEDRLTTLPWVTDAITAKLHLTTPRLDGKAPFGDQAQVSAAYLGDHDRTPMLIGTRWDGRCAPWLNRINPNRCQQRLNLWEEFLFWNPPLPTGEAD